MALCELTLESLKDLDFGKADEAFRAHLLRVATDCLDRPADPKPRKVTLTVGVVPAVEADGTCERVRLQIAIASKLPDHRTRVYDLALRKNGKLVFSSDSPDNFDQTTIFDGGD